MTIIVLLYQPDTTVKYKS